MYVSLKAERAIGQKYRMIFPAKDDNGNSYMIDGWVLEKGRVDVFYDESEYNAIHQELLQRREEVAELSKRLDQMKEDRELLLREIDELSSERKEMLETIERAVDERRVVIPKEVAKAIEQARMSGHEWELFYSEHINQKADRSIQHFQVIAEYMKNIKNVKTYFSALINGYTTKEAALEEQVNRMLHEWLETEYEGDEETDRREFAKRLVSFMRRELETKSR